MSVEEGRISDWIIKNHRKYIVINKPSGLAVQRTKEEEPGLEQIASAYAKRDLHVINRIDRPVSGVVIMAKDPETAAQLSAIIPSNSTQKTYLAIVQKSDFPRSGTLKHFVKKTNNKSIIVDAGHPKAKEAILSYQTLKELDNYVILQVHTETGRFHQIRSQLAAIGAHIKGDVKYGSRRANKDRSIHLHAYKVAYPDPISGEKVEWLASLPKDVLWDQINT